MMKTPMRGTALTKIGLLLVGGHHHILHLIPIAAELEKKKDYSVTVFVMSDVEAKACREILDKLGAKKTNISILKIGKLGKRISPKLSFLLGNMSVWKNLDCLVVAERTSTALRYFPQKLPLFIHIPHGAGDRAKSYDPRIRHFDHVLVAGDKDKRRMIELGLVDEVSCHVTGYIKPYAVKRMYPIAPKIFDNTLPTVLYNPHFSAKLSSWDEFGLSLLNAFAARKDMNFIFAPHVRLFAKKNADMRRKAEFFAKFDNIHIDLGSPMSTDMTYTRAADIYLGDVSSQVYEFLNEPKPCIFITNTETQWEQNPDYAHWAYGPVCHSAQDVMGALYQAMLTLPNYAEVQAQGCLAAKGDPNADPISKAAKIVESILSRL